MDIVGGMIIFARVVEANSFSAAARRLGLSKSAVSKQIAALEDRLGARLLNRTTRRLSPTEVGAALYERCARVAAEVEEAEQIVTRLHTAPRGVLRVNAPVSFGHLHLAPVIPDFMAQYPELQVELTLNDRFVDVVEEGYDMVVRIGLLRDSSMVARKLASSGSVLCASRAYLDRHGDPKTPGDLADHDCIAYSYLAEPREWRLIDGQGHRHTVRITGRLTVNNGDAILAALCAGGGIGLLPAFIVQDAVVDGRLERVLPGYDIPELGIYALYPHARHLSPKVRAFVDFLAVRFGPAQVWDRATA